MILAQKMKQWFADPVESIGLQMPRALIASVLALALDFCLLEMCLRVFGMSAVFAAIIGYLAGTLLQYVLCTVWVFAPSSEPVNFVGFVLLSLVGLGITWAIILVMHQFAGAPVELAKA